MLWQDISDNNLGIRQDISDNNLGIRQDMSDNNLMLWQDISDNNLGREGAKILAEAIRENESIMEISAAGRYSQRLSVIAGYCFTYCDVK